MEVFLFAHYTNKQMTSFRFDNTHERDVTYENYHR